MRSSWDPARDGISVLLLGPCFSRVGGEDASGSQMLVPAPFTFSVLQLSEAYEKRYGWCTFFHRAEFLQVLKTGFLCVRLCSF